MELSVESLNCADKVYILVVKKLYVYNFSLNSVRFQKLSCKFPEYKLTLSHPASASDPMKLITTKYLGII